MMHILLIPVTLILMALCGLVIKHWPEIESWINGDPQIPTYELTEVIYPKEFRETERWPMCPGEGCPHQMIGGTLWTGEYCYRYLPPKSGVRYV